MKIEILVIGRWGSGLENSQLTIDMYRRWLDVSSRGVSEHWRSK